MDFHISIGKGRCSGFRIDPHSWTYCMGMKKHFVEAEFT